MEDSFPVPVAWEQRLQDKCNVDIDYTMKFNNASFLQAGVFALFYTAYFGCMKFGESNLKGDESALSKGVIAAVVAAPAAIPYVFYSKTIDPYHGFVFCTTLPCLYAGFMLYFVTPKIAQMFGLASRATSIAESKFSDIEKGVPQGLQTVFLLQNNNGQPQQYIIV